MLNLRVSGIIAIAAFIISLLIGLVSHASMSVLFIRALIFAVSFFFITVFVNFLVSNFLPELLDKGIADPAAPLPGSRIDISEAAPPASAQAFFGAQADESDEGLGNISDLVSARNTRRETSTPAGAGMDQIRQSSYNEEGNLEELSEPEAVSPVELVSPSETIRSAVPLSGGSSGTVVFEKGESSGAEAGFPDSVDILPDLDSMAGAFLPSAGAAESDTTEYSVSTPAPKPSSGGKAPSWAGDFNAKDMASGLRTILSKEKEG
jgi:hypothetical protein